MFETKNNFEKLPPRIILQKPNYDLELKLHTKDKDSNTRPYLRNYEFPNSFLYEDFDCDLCQRLDQKYNRISTKVSDILGLFGEGTILSLGEYSGKIKSPKNPIEYTYNSKKRVEEEWFWDWVLDEESSNLLTQANNSYDYGAAFLGSISDAIEGIPNNVEVFKNFAFRNMSPTDSIKSIPILDLIPKTNDNVSWIFEPAECQSELPKQTIASLEKIVDLKGLRERLEDQF